MQIAENKQFDHVIELLTASFRRKKRIGGAPTASHSLRVGLSLMRYGYSQSVWMGGFTHDLIEDTKVTFEQLEEWYGTRVAQLADACTFDQSMEEVEGEEKLNHDVIALAKAGDWEPLIIKCADALDNLGELHNLTRDKQWRCIDAAQMRLDAAWDCIPDSEDHRLLADLEFALTREVMRLEYS